VCCNSASRAIHFSFGDRDLIAEDVESCNCGDETYVDHHLWLAGSPGASKARAMVVEVSPRTWLTHPTWRDNETFKQLVRAKVRVAGWLMWDQEHQPHVGHSRLTLWEIHPHPHDPSVQRRPLGRRLIVSVNLGKAFANRTKKIRHSYRRIAKDNVLQSQLILNQILAWQLI
jgi:hypothetical protein